MINKVAVVILSLLFSILLINLNLMTFSMAILFILLPIILIYPEVYFIAFILTRPVIDIYSDYAFIGSINLASIFTIFLILVCGIVPLTQKKLSNVKNNEFVMTFNKFFLLFLIFSLFSLTNSKDFLAYLADFLRLLSILVVFNFAAFYFSERKESLITLILLSSIVPLCFGIYQALFKLGFLKISEFNRIYGTFVHPNVFAQYLSLIFFLLLFILTSYKVKTFLKIVLYLMLIFITFEILYTFTRSVWIALLVAFLFYTLIKSRFFSKIVLFLVGFLFIIFVYGIVQKRFEDLAHSTPYQMSSWEWRLRLWAQSLDNLREHPIIGNGLGMFQLNVGVMAHNDYLRIAYETGFLGLFFYLFLLFYILFFSIRKIYKIKLSAERNKYKLVVCLMVSLLIISLADNLARSTIISIYYFAVIGTCLGFINNRNLMSDEIKVLKDV